MSGFDRAAFQRRRATEALGRDLQVHDVLPSTMDAAHEALAAGAPHGAVVLAERQTRGRGRRGHAWHAAPGRHLTFSVVLRGVGVEGLTLAAGLGVARALGRFAASPLAIKWPNDVWLGAPPRKVAGVLVEARSATMPHDVVLGIGVNIARERWPEDLEATALHDHGTSAPREDVLAALLHELERALDDRESRGVTAIVRSVEERLLWRGQPVRCGDVRGILAGLADDGALVLESPRGRHVVRAGAVRPDRDGARDDA